MWSVLPPLLEDPLNNLYRRYFFLHTRDNYRQRHIGSADRVRAEKERGVNFKWGILVSWKHTAPPSLPDLIIGPHLHRNRSCLRAVTLWKFTLFWSQYQNEKLQQLGLRSMMRKVFNLSICWEDKMSAPSMCSPIIVSPGDAETNVDDDDDDIALISHL